MTTHENFWVCRLSREQHLRTCGYWYTVTADGGLPHTAFATRAGLDRWMNERGLSVDGKLSDDEWACVRIVGTYRTMSHLHDAAGFDAIQGERTRTLSNGDWVVAILERCPDGIVTVHTLNPNVRERQTFDYPESRAMMS